MAKKSLRQLEQERLAALKGPQHDWLVGHRYIKGHIVPNIEDDLRRLNRDAIVKLFPSTVRNADDPKHHPKSDVNDAQLMRMLIWQQYLLTLDGQMNPLEGNLRSFWYRIVEPFYTKHAILDLPAGPSVETVADLTGILELFNRAQREPDDVELYGSISEGGRHGAYVLGLMAACFDAFVRNRIFTFREPFQFFDPREKFHTVGSQTPSFILYTEKEGLWPFVRQLAHSKGISAMASHGEPGLVTLEYFTSQLRGHFVSFLRVCALNDYDPWGWEIGDNARAHIQEPAFGNEEENGAMASLQVDLHRLTSLDLFDRDVIRDTKRDLSSMSGSKAKEVQQWMENGGGINGKPWSLHVDNANKNKIKKAFEKWYHDARAKAHQDKRKPHPERRDPQMKERDRFSNV